MQTSNFNADDADDDFEVIVKNKTVDSPTLIHSHMNIVQRLRVRASNGLTHCRARLRHHRAAATQNRLRDATLRAKYTPQYDSGYAWLVMLLAFVCMMIDGMFCTFGLWYQHIREEFGLSEFHAQWINSVQFASGMMLSPVSSVLIERVGTRVFLCSCSAIATASLLVTYAFADRLFVFYVFYGVIAGIAYGSNLFGLLVIISEYFEKRRDLATGIVMSGSGIGIFAFSHIIKCIIERYTWKNVMLFQAAGFLQLFSLELLFFSPWKTLRLQLRGNKSSANARPSHQQTQTPAGVSAVPFSSSTAAAAAAPAAISFSNTSIFGSSILQFVQKRQGLSATPIRPDEMLCSSTYIRSFSSLIKISRPMPAASPPRDDQSQSDSPQKSRGTITLREKLASRYKPVLTNPSVLLYMISVVFTHPALLIMISFVMPIVTSQFQFSASQLSVVLSIQGLSSAFGRVCPGLVNLAVCAVYKKCRKFVNSDDAQSTRAGKTVEFEMDGVPIKTPNNGKEFKPPRLAISICILFMMSLLLSIGFLFTSYPLLIVLALFTGIFIGSIISTEPIMIAECIPEQLIITAMSLVVCVMGFSTLIITPLVGSLIQTLQSVKYGFFILSGMFGMAGLLMLCSLLCVKSKSNKST